MSDNVPMTPEARWRHLRENGPKLLVDLTSNELIRDKPEWLDEARFALAKKTLEKYYIGVTFSSFTGLLLILQLPDGLEPLLVTGNSKDIPSLYKRYLSTILHVNSWYEDDVFNPDTKGYKSIRQVRAMHRRVQQLMNERFQVNDLNDKPRKWMSQYDVALTQWAFIGLAMLYPKKSALIAASDTDLEHLNYYWRVLGWLMGMKDEFNACQFDKYEDIREFNRLIFKHEYKDKFEQSPCPLGLEMTKSICVALHYFTPLITFNQLAHWWKDCFLFNGYEPQPMTAREKVLDFWTSLSFNRLLKYDAFISFSTKLHKKRFYQRLENKDKVYEDLRQQYKDNTTCTFYSDRVDYFGTKNIEEKNNQDDANNNNNNETAFDVSSKACQPATNTFQGCPFAYETHLPALMTTTSGQVSAPETTVAA